MNTRIHSLIFSLFLLFISPMICSNAYSATDALGWMSDPKIVGTPTPITKVPAPTTTPTTSTTLNNVSNPDSARMAPPSASATAGGRIDLGDCVTTSDLSLLDIATPSIQPVIKTSVAIPCDVTGSCFQPYSGSWATCPAGYVVVATAISGTVTKVAYIPIGMVQVKAVQDFQLKIRQKCCKLYGP